MFLPPIWVCGAHEEVPVFTPYAKSYCFRMFLKCRYYSQFNQDLFFGAREEDLYYVPALQYDGFFSENEDEDDESDEEDAFISDEEGEEMHCVEYIN